MQLCLYLTRGWSLTGWQKVGLLDREMALYARLSRQCERICVYSYASDPTRELAIARQFGDNIGVLCRPPWMSNTAYSLFGPRLHREVLTSVDIHKSNQSNGAWAAYLGSRMEDKCFVYRSGYIWSKNLGFRLKTRVLVPLAVVIERVLLSKCGGCIVTSDQAVEWATQGAPSMEGRLIKLPNYVDTERFHPVWDARSAYRVAFVGRNQPEKNFHFIIESLAGSQTLVDVIGRGFVGSAEHVRSQHSELQANFLGVVEHSAIPALLNRSWLLLMPSRYEGNPKAALEAMSCGLPVIGCDVSGVREVIQDGETGLLLPPDPHVWREAILDLLSNPERCRQMGQNARDWIISTCSLDHIVQQEIEFYVRCLAAQQAAHCETLL